MCAGVKGWCEACNQYHPVELHPERKQLPRDYEGRYVLVQHNRPDGSSCSHSGVMPECIVLSAA